MNYTILVVEDDENISFGINSFFTREGFHIICCGSLSEAREAFTNAVNLVILDLNLPDGSGHDFCRMVKSKIDTPIIFLTVRDDETDIVQGLDMGADDYIIKPFHLSVLLARVNAVLRRFGKNNDGKASDLLCCGGIRMDTKATRVWSNGKEITLSAGEYRLLNVLLENKNITMTRTVLLERLWDIDKEFVNDNTLTVTMKRLREKLGNPQCIRTLRGIGYRMEDSL